MATYQLAPCISPETAASLADHAPHVQQLLVNRNITDSSAAANWLTPPYAAALHDPFLLHDMGKAVNRLQKAITQEEHIVIYSDYDCDGIPGAVVLHDFLTEIGYQNFSVYIPHRHYEGFGFNEAAAVKLAEAGAKLIVTIDCGIADGDAVAAAQNAGVDVIITDHHQAAETLPLAVAVVNPAISPQYPYPHLCGAGVVFKLIQALLASNKYAVYPGREKWWLDMVGLATVADMVPLQGENRTLAHYGLTVLRKSRRPGLRALLQAQRASQPHLTEDDIGFTIGPRINAASRMGEPLRAFKLLTATSKVEAREHLNHIEQLNNERKGAVAAMTRAAHKKLTAQERNSAVIVLGDPEWRPSLVGLVANTLSEEHQVPAFVWGRDGNGVIKGSARAGNELSILALMEAAKEHFIEFGGHHASGGFSVNDQAIHSLPKTLELVAQTHRETLQVVEPTIIDVSIAAAELSVAMISDMLTLGPFGVGNPKPLLQITDVAVTDVAVFGKTKEHTKLTFSIGTTVLESIAFFTLPEKFSSEPKPGATVALIAHPEQSYFMGRLQTRLRLVDVLFEPVT